MAVKLTVRLGGDEFSIDGAPLADVKTLLADWYQRRDAAAVASLTDVTRELKDQNDTEAAMVAEHQSNP